MRLIVINTASDPEFTALRAKNTREIADRPVIAGLPIPGRSGRRVLPTDMLRPEVLDQLEHLVEIGNVRVVETGQRGPVDFDALRRRLRYPARSDAAVERVPEAHQQVATALARSPALEKNATPAEHGMVVPPMAAAPESATEERVAEDAERAADKAAAVPEAMIQLESQLRAKTVTDLEDRGAPLGLHGSRRDVALSTERDPGERDPLGLHYEGRLDGTGTVGHGEEDPLDRLLSDDTTPAKRDEATPEKWVEPEDLEELIEGSKNAALASALAVFGQKSGGMNKAQLAEELLERFDADDLDAVNAHKALKILRANGVK